jgi:hypothetical protein
MPALQNISVPGGHVFDPVVYASAGLTYGAVPQLAQYTLFDHPDPAYVTGRIDISAFADLGASIPWPFPNTAVPLNGILRVPRGRGPFPLAVFAHGNHDPFENSTPGLSLSLRAARVAWHRGGYDRRELPQRLQLR